MTNRRPVIILLLALASCVAVARAVLIGEPTRTQNQTNEIQTSSEQISNTNQHQPQALDSNSTFYYEADAFLLNRAEKSQSSPTLKQLPAPASMLMTSARNGRMLDLDALVGDIATSKMNKERHQTGNRQSRFIPSLDLPSGKQLHIQGFIPIVGLKDVDSDQDADASQQQNQHQQSGRQLAPQAKHLLSPKSPVNSNQVDLYHPQSSIGHATFGVQRYLNTDNSQPQQIDLKSSDANIGSGSSSALVDSLKWPIKRLAGSYNSQQSNSESHNCLCVPFYMCKNGFVSESTLTRSQVQQLVAQQQQQQQQQSQQLAQQPRQVETQSIPLKAGATEPPSSSQKELQFANSYVPVDERSLDRELVTLSPTALEDQLPSVANLSATESPSASEEQTKTASADDTSDAASMATAGSSSSSDDYAQDILGRMLGLKQSTAGGSGASAASGSTPANVCGLLRTCCQLAIEREQSPPARPIPVPPQRHQQYHQQQSQQQQQQSTIYGHPSNQISLTRNVAPAAAPFAHQNSGHFTSFSNKYGSQVAPQVAQQQVAQYSRSSSQLLPQQQQQQQPQFQLSSATNFAPSLELNSKNLVAPLGSRRLLEGRCGLRQSTGITGRVQNLPYHESSADFGEYPAQAAILKRLNGTESLFVCGATLISQYWVATAAHCIRKHPQSELKVRLGEWDVHRDDEFYPFVEKEIRDLVIHPEFVAGNLINDLALIRLDSPLDPSLPHVNPACLPLANENFARQRCWVTGWGKDSFGQRGSFQSVLREVELPVVGHNECEAALRQTRLGPHYRLHAGFICAGGEGGRDACEGDGGSGLYCLHEGVLKAAGLVSWGIGCGQQGVPGVYVNLAHYRSWIENIIAIDEDVYSPHNNLIGAGSPISERSNANSSAPMPAD